MSVLSSPVVLGGVLYPELTVGCTEDGVTSVYRTNDPWLKSDFLTIYPWVGNKVYLRRHGQWLDWCSDEGRVWFGDQFVSCILDLTKGNKSPETNKYHSLIFELDLFTNEYRTITKSSSDGQTYQTDTLEKTIKCEPMTDD